MKSFYCVINIKNASKKMQVPFCKVWTKSNKIINYKKCYVIESNYNFLMIPNYDILYLDYIPQHVREGADTVVFRTQTEIRSNSIF